MENNTIKQLLNRKSIRNFTGEEVKKEDLDLILKAAQRAPTSINGQQISIVYTRDKEVIKKISELCGGQKQVETADIFVMFVIDFNRTDIALKKIGAKQVVEKSVEGVLVGAVDAGIILSSLQAAAESLGYGTTAIGAVRIYPDKMIELLNLPKNTFPVVGSTIGVATDEAKNSPLKPRVPMDSFAFENKYNNELLEKGVEQYEKDLNKFRNDNNMSYLTSYYEQTASFYSKYYMGELGAAMKKQGFDFNDK